jgi:hypothetical protein
VAVGKVVKAPPVPGPHDCYSQGSNEVPFLASQWEDSALFEVAAVVFACAAALAE